VPARGRTGEVELAEVLAEEGLRGLAEAVDGVAAALAEVDLVGVHLEDLLLVEAGLELEGDHELGELALDGLVGREEEVLRASCWVRVEPPQVLAAGEEVVDGAFGGAEVVDAAVLEEAAVLDGGDGLDHVRGISS
jgi:hypothetical protein